MTTSENTDGNLCSPCGNWWRLPLLLATVLAAIVLYRIWHPAETPLSSKVRETAGQPAGASALPVERVVLAIDFGAGKKREYPAVGWREGMTVRDVLSQVSDVLVIEKGSGPGAFLVSINGVANEDADGRNWTYAVNGMAADRSFAVYELRPGDRILWSFGSRR